MNVDDNVRTLQDHATRLMQAGRLDEAIEAHERLVARAPDLPDAWYNLGYLQHRARRFDAALQSYRRALDGHVGMPEEVHLNRAVILAEQLTRTKEAKAELRSALGLNPRYVPAWLNLGNVHEQCGDLAAAVRAYESARAIDPENAVALARLANLKSTGLVTDPLIADLRRALRRSSISAADYAELAFGLGKALDAAGAYDEAFAAYRAANRASRVSAGPRGAHYDARAHEQFVDRLIEAFSSPNPSLVPEPAFGAPPIFICGLFRSGSSLVEQILASHSKVRSGGEVDLLPALAGQALGPFGESAARVDTLGLERMRRAYLGGLHSRHPGSGVLTDKRPDNFLYIGLILRMFPNARILHTRRNPLDNCLSIFFLHLDHAMPYALDLNDIAHWHGQYRRLMAHWKEVFGDAIHDVDYDDLVLNPRPIMGNLLAHCGLPWEEGCMAFHTAETVVKTPSAWQVRLPLYAHSSGRWRRYEKHLQGLRAALAGQ
jgi:tetratricopeptide (TPR) repeat protein